GDDEGCDYPANRARHRCCWRGHSIRANNSVSACPNRTPDMLSEENNSKEQKNAELEVESFRKNLGPFVVAAETTRMPMAFTDAEKANHPLVFANESFLSLTGYDQKEVLGQSFDFLMVR